MKSHYVKLANKRILQYISWQNGRQAERCSSLAEAFGLKEKSLDWWKNLSDRESLKSTY